MIFSKSFLSINVLSVLDLKWEQGRHYAKPRPFHALSFRVEGNADFIHDDKTIRVKRGDIAFVPLGYHYELNSSDEHVIAVHFDLKGENPSEMETFSPLNSSVFKNLFQQMYTVWSGKHIGYRYAVSALLYKTFEQIQLQHSEQRLMSSEKMKYAIEYIHEHFTDSQLSVSRIAEVLAMSDTYFRKLFTSNFSITPLKYINNLRIVYAEDLLRSGYYSVEKIAEKSGFTNAKYFSAVIKKHRGLSPMKLYKKKYS